MDAEIKNLRPPAELTGPGGGCALNDDGIFVDTQSYRTLLIVSLCGWMDVVGYGYECMVNSA